MTIKEILFREIESTPEEILEETLDFLRFLKTKQTTVRNNTSSISTPIQSTGRSLVEHLKTIGTWEGEDAEECLSQVKATRSKARFEQHNPFDE